MSNCKCVMRTALKYIEAYCDDHSISKYALETLKKLEECAPDDKPALMEIIDSAFDCKVIDDVDQEAMAEKENQRLSDEEVLGYGIAWEDGDVTPYVSPEEAKEDFEREVEPGTVMPLVKFVKVGDLEITTQIRLIGKNGSVIL